jgi:adenine deaminase
MLTLTEFAKAVIPHGTTTVVIDPHELVNITGTKGLELLIYEASKSPIDFLIELPSCVPSLPGFETSGAVLSSEEISELIRKKEIFALAEMMNYPGVINGFDDVIKKINSAKEAGKMIEGHAPLLSGKELQTYIAAGINSDHEATSVDEALEKIRLGMKLQIREGSFAKDLENILSKLDLKNIDTRNLLIASDDRNPIDLFEKGHLDYSYKKMINLGINPIEALQMMTINTATHLGLQNQIGGIAPGKKANIVVVSNLNDFDISLVISNGTIIFRNGELILQEEKTEYPSFIFNTMENLETPTLDDLVIKSDKEEVVVSVIGLQENSLITEKNQHLINVKDGVLLPDIENDVLPVFVVNRHTKEKKIGKGFVKGLGIKNAAIASTVAHDSHQLICTGTDYNLILTAIKELKESQGGQVIVTQDKTTLLQLDFAGIMSSHSLNDVVNEHKELHDALKSIKPSISEPFMALAFIALPVIPHLKITDHGLVDVDEMKIVRPIINE